MAVLLLDFPQELISRVLCFLDVAELSVLQQTHSTFRRLIQESQDLQYRIATARAGVINNPHSPHTVSERLALLKNREEGWLHMNIDFQKSIPIVELPAIYYDLTGGTYFMGDMSKKSIYYCQIPARPSDTVAWKTINVDKALVGIGVSVYEFNFIAILTYSSHPTILSHRIIEMVLLELSTGKPHPLAKNPILFIGETQGLIPSVHLKVVGEHLVLVMRYDLLRVPDTLRVYEWKTGALKMNIERPHFTYHDSIFLSPTVILLPNHHLNMLDVWEIPIGTKPAPIEPFLSLTLPSLSFGSAVTLTCHCEPNPTPEGTPHSEAPFHPDPKDAIVVLDARIEASDGVGAYSLFVHRSDLLRVCTTDRPEDEDGASHYIPSTLTIEPIPGKRIRAWDNWGPPITRVFNTSRASLRYVTITAGQRAIVGPDYLEDPDDRNEDDEDGRYSRLLDFNLVTVKRVERDRIDGSGEFDSHELVLYTTVTAISGIEVPIRSGLPYVYVDAPFQNSWRNGYQGFLLYEEGFVVLPSGNDDDVEEKIEVLHVGVSA